MLGEAENLRRPLAVLVAVSLAVLASVVTAAGQTSAFVAPPESDGGTASASAQNFEQSLRMRITKTKGKRMVAKGSTVGTVEGKVSLRLRTINGSKVRAIFFGRNSHGTVRGIGAARYRISGAISSYTGEIKTLEGTGRYSHARSRGISLSGIANRRTFKVKMALRGK